MLQDDQAILFRGIQKFYIENTQSKTDYPFAALAVNKELSRYGYTLSLEALTALSHCSMDEIVEFKEMFTSIIDKEIGVSDFHSSQPFYPGFPQQVMEKSEAELYFNSFVYYLFGQTDNPEMTAIANDFRNSISNEHPTEWEPLPESEFKNLKVINLAKENELERMLYNRTQALNMSDSQFEDMQLYAKNHPDWLNRIFDIEELEIPSHETRAKLAYLAHTQGDNLSMKRLLRHAEDVLRYASFLMHTKGSRYNHMNANLDYNYKNNNNLFKFSKPEQREIKDLLNSCPDLFTSIWHRPELFEKLKNRINAKDKRYNRVVKAFDNLSNKKKVDELGNPIENDILKKALQEIRDYYQTNGLVPFATKNPKIFMRNVVNFAEALEFSFDLFNDSEVADKIKNQFASAIHIAATSVPVSQALDLKNYFINTENINERPFNATYAPRKNGYMVYENKQFISKEIRDFIIQELEQTIVKKTSEFKLQGKVYIDDELKNRKVPTRSIRSASKGNIVTQYSTVPCNTEKNIVAAGIFWKNAGDERADIDLSTAFITENGYYESVYYNHQKNAFACHSGDYTNGIISEEINGAEEFIFIDKQKAKEHDIKYIIFNVHGFSKKFSEAESVRFCLMNKDGSLNDVTPMKDIDDYDYDYCTTALPPKFKGEIVNPTEIDFSCQLTQNATQAAPAMYDVEHDAFIFLDAIREVGQASNIEDPKSASNNDIELYRATHNDIPDMASLFQYYADEIVNSPEEADIVFSAVPIDAKKMGLKEDVVVITANELDKISSEFCDPKHNEVRPDRELEKAIVHEDESYER
jgi:hypothetical protein